MDRKPLLVSLFVLINGCQGVDNIELGESQHPIFNGTNLAPSDAEAEGIVLVKMPNGDVASGVIVSDGWALTAMHAVTTSSGSTFKSVNLSAGSWSGDFDVNPLLSVGSDLIMINLKANKYSYSISRRFSPYSSPDSTTKYLYEPTKTTIKCYGYGNNSVSITDQGTVFEGIGVPRHGDMIVDKSTALPGVGTVLLTLPVPGATVKQEILPGDSGGPCFAQDEFGQRYLAAISRGGPSDLSSLDYGKYGYAIGEDLFTEAVVNRALSEKYFDSNVVSKIDSSTPWNDHVFIGQINDDIFFDYVYIGVNNIYVMMANKSGSGRFNGPTSTSIDPCDQNNTTMARLSLHKKDGKEHRTYDWVEVKTDKLVARISNLDGSFGPPVESPLGSQGWNDGKVFFGDVNRDFIDDLVYIGDGYIKYLKSKGNGSFEPSSAIITHNYVGASAFGWTDKNRMFVQDMNSDGFVDFIYVGSNRIDVVLGSDHGGFTDSVSSTTVSIPGSTNGIDNPEKIRTSYVDVNGDKVTDIVFARSFEVFVFLGKLDGTFNTPIRSLFEYAGDWDATTKDYKFHLADINGDGRSDYVMAGQSTIWTKLGTSSGTFGGMKITHIPLKIGLGITADHCVFADVSRGLKTTDDRLCVTKNQIVSNKSLIPTKKQQKSFIIDTNLSKLSQEELVDEGPEEDFGDITNDVPSSSGLPTSEYIKVLKLEAANTSQASSQGSAVRSRARRWVV